MALPIAETSFIFANANLFMEQIEELVTQAPKPVKWFVLDAQAMVDIDTTGAESLKQTLTLMADYGVTFSLSRAGKVMLSLLMDKIILQKIHETYSRCF